MRTIATALVLGIAILTITSSQNALARKAGGDSKSAGKPFLQYKFGTVFTTRSGSTGPTKPIPLAGTAPTSLAPKLGGSTGPTIPPTPGGSRK
jgi:hypothetical protein